jgi:RNA polymerase sigma factor (sigma-70 family)
VQAGRGSPPAAAQTPLLEEHVGTYAEPLDDREAIRLPSGALAALPDAIIARLVAGGQERPFEVLFGRYKTPLYRYCTAFLRSPEDAQDALQVAMANAFRALSKGFPENLAVKPWLYRIAHRECLNILRRRDIHQELSGSEEAPGPGVDELAEHSEQVRQLAADLAALAPRARQALLLRELAGLSHDDIGIALDAAPTVARNLVYEAREALAEIAEGRTLACSEVRRTISGGDGRTLRGRRIGAHLRACIDCSAYR